MAKIYQELQRRKECQPFSENMIKEKADYFLLLQHGGGKGNRACVPRYLPFQMGGFR